MTKPQTPPTNTDRRAAAPARSGAKARAMKVAGKYDEATRAKALASLESKGMAETHRRTGIPKSTLTRWAKAAGVDVGEQARARTANATDAVRARAAEVKLSTVELLEQHIAQAADYLSTVAGVNALAAQLIARTDPDNITVQIGMAGPYAVVTDAQAAEVSKVALALAGLPLAVRDAEGVLTRAVHDLQLLRGEATERGELVVEFNVPRPTMTAEPVLELDTTDD